MISGWKEAYRKILSRRMSAWIFIEFIRSALSEISTSKMHLYTNLTAIQKIGRVTKWRCLNREIHKERGSTGKEITIFKLSLSILISFPRSLLLFILPPS